MSNSGGGGKNLKRSGNILLAGVGGQGILLASEVLAYTLIEAGYDLKKSEVHGMAQRGGSVIAHLRYAERVYSPLIEPGEADVLVAFEMLEAIRYVTFLHPDSLVVLNTQKIPPPGVTAGNEGYPTDITARLRGRGLDVREVDAFGAASSLGESRAVNMVLVGALSKFLPVKQQMFMDIISARVPKRFRDVNLRALVAGRKLAGGGGDDGKARTKKGGK